MRFGQNSTTAGLLMFPGTPHRENRRIKRIIFFKKKKKPFKIFEFKTFFYFIFCVIPRIGRRPPNPTLFVVYTGSTMRSRFVRENRRHKKKILRPPTDKVKNRKKKNISISSTKSFLVYYHFTFDVSSNRSACTF